MGGTNYVRSKEGISRIHESILSLMIEEFISHSGKQIDADTIKSLINNKFSSWESCKVSLAVLESEFYDFAEKRCAASENFRYFV